LKIVWLREREDEEIFEMHGSTLKIVGRITRDQGFKVGEFAMEFLIPLNWI
jgi:hypothetical protein